MKHVVTSAPAVEPVTLAEMREHLGITQAVDTARDDIITSRIRSARVWAEDYTRRAFITQTITGYDSQWPVDKGFDYYIRLKLPLISVTSVKYYDTDGAQQTLGSDLYDVDTIEGCIVPGYDDVWPDYRLQPNSIQVVYQAGYGATAGDVPDPIKEAIRFIVGQWEVFQPSIEGIVRPFTIPYAAQELLKPYIDTREYF